MSQNRNNNREDARRRGDTPEREREALQDQYTLEAIEHLQSSLITPEAVSRFQKMASKKKNRHRSKSPPISSSSHRGHSTRRNLSYDDDSDHGKTSSKRLKTFPNDDCPFSQHNTCKRVVTAQHNTCSAQEISTLYELIIITMIITLILSLLSID
mmetsp:Transcript_20550/g.20663  ORF Transcript_20550/g.20663 Transcript_20550/m.20663 type:complete len:155 (+) Transcript_20550:137-601(+)